MICPYCGLPMNVVLLDGVEWWKCGECGCTESTFTFKKSPKPAIRGCKTHLNTGR